MIIVTQIPEMIKNNEDAMKKISVIQNIINFQSLLVVKQDWLYIYNFWVFSINFLYNLIEIENIYG